MQLPSLIIGKEHVTALAIQEDGWTFVRLKRSRKSIKVVTSGAVANAQEFSKHCPKRIPVVLVVYLPTSIHRVVDLEGEIPQLIGQVLPDAPLAEMLASGWSDQGSSGLSFIRKNEVEDAWGQLTDNGYRVVRITVGPWQILSLRQLLEHDEKAVFEIGGHRFLLDQDRLIDYEHKDEASDLIIDDEHIPASMLLAFAAGWQHLLPDLRHQDLDDLMVVEAREEERARVGYERALIIAATVLLLIMSVERSVFHYLSTLQEELKVSISDQQVWQQRTDELRTEHAQKLRLAGELGLLSPRSFAATGHRIARSVPKDVVLNDLEMAPMVPSEDHEQPLRFQAGNIMVGGTAQNAGSLTRWVTTLDSFPEFKRAELMQYTQGEGTTKPTFRIRIQQ